MAEAPIVVPTLSASTLLSDPRAIIAYVLRQYASAPKNATSTWVEETISLRYTLAKYASAEPETVSASIQHDLSRVFNTLFPEGATVTVTRTDEATGYSLQIAVSVVKAGELHTIDKSVIVSPDGHLTIEDAGPVEF
jgi:hypothetical protein